jgi:hypothetical protein
LPDKEVIFIYTVGRLPCPSAQTVRIQTLRQNLDTRGQY